MLTGSVMHSIGFIPHRMPLAPFALRLKVTSGKRMGATAHPKFMERRKIVGKSCLKMSAERCKI